jgi:hypothetical protein
MKTLLLILLSVIPITAQPATFDKVKAEIEAQKDSALFVEYNKFRESVTVGARPDGVVASCFTVKPKDGASFVGVIFERSGRDWKWLGVSSLRLIADESRAEWKDGSRRSQILTGRTSVSVFERLLFAPTNADFEQMFFASKTELLIGIEEFTIPSKTLSRCATAYRIAKTL